MTRTRWIAVARAGATVGVLGVALAQSRPLVGTLLLCSVWSIAAVGLAPVVGFAGQPSLCQGAFVLVGAYVYSWTASPTFGGAPPLVALVAACAATALLAWFVSPVLRLRGFTFAIGSIALGLLIQDTLRVGGWLPGGELGILDVPPAGALGLTADSSEAQLAVAVVCLAGLVLVLDRAFGTGSVRRELDLVGHDEELLELLGGDPAARKQRVFVVSGLAAALAGALFAASFGFVQPETFGMMESFTLAVAVMIGGRDRLGGAIVGALLFELTGSLLGEQRADLRPALLGALVIATMHLFPRGLLPTWAELSGRRRSAPSAPASARAEEPGGSSDGGLGLEVRGAVRSFGGTTALDGLDLTIEPGALVGLIGPNGAGKTTLMASVTGQPLDAGSVRIGGEDVTFWPASRRSRLGVARTFQSPRLVDASTVLDNVLAGADAFARRSVRTDEPERRRAAAAALDSVGLLELADRPCGELDTTGRRLVELARLLASRPRLALLDEPSSGLDPGDAERVAGVVRRLNDRGCTVVVVEHDLDFIGRLVDEVHVVADGRMLVSGPLAEVLEHEGFRTAYLGTGAT